ncbi:MAG: PIG-L family deacetylase [Bacteroidales bacterium]|nr:PIG-L family deacetylase [Bacteroidales bacterium]
MMDTIRYIYRYLRNSILRILAILNGKELKTSDKILIISPHPDDEILGCGGLIIQMIQQGKEVFIVFMTKGENCKSKIDSKILIAERRKLTNIALNIVRLSMDHVYFLDFIDGKINFGDPEMEKLKALIDEIAPQTVFVPHHFEGWNDHVQSNQIIKILIKDKPIKLFEYCVWFWYTMPFSKVFDLEWKNARILKMDKKVNQTKIKAINLYMDGKDPEGLPYSGVLPSILITSCGWREEIYFEN